MGMTRRAKVGAGAAAAGLVLMIGIVTALAGGGGDEDDDDRAGAAADEQSERDRRQPTTTTSSTTSTVPPTTTTAPAAPSTAAGTSTLDEGSDQSSGSHSQPPSYVPPPPPLSPPPTGPYVDPRPEAIDYSASCQTTGPTTVVGTARVVWSDGFVDEFSATFTSPGYRQSADGGQRGWWVIVDVVAPPDGTIGNYACSNASTGGPIYWDG